MCDVISFFLIDTHVDTILIEAPQDKIDHLHANASDESLKYEGIKVIYARLVFNYYNILIIPMYGFTK